jgi:CubicO group peptidase (beta-lactamase class C family)
MKRVPILAVLLLIAGPHLGAQAPPQVDAVVAAAMRTFSVPGMAVAIVKDGKTILTKGYGVRCLPDGPRPCEGGVDEETLFPIASNTKVFTALALGLLVEAKRLEWDAPVTRYLPWFRLSNPFVTAELTVRDLLVHRSGLSLGAGDLLWWPPSTYTRRQIAERLQFLPLSTSFRSAYAYDNVLYLVAGEVIEVVSGQSWEDFVAERLLTPLGMTASSPKLSTTYRPGNIAMPHAPLDGIVRQIAPFASDNTNPAGGILTTAADMAKWLRAYGARGQLPNGSRLFSEGTARQLENIVTPLPSTTPPAELGALRANFRGYALGLLVRDYRGRKVVNHTGGLPGYVSQVTWMPEIGLGIAVLTNQESSDAFNAVTWSIVDYYLGVSDTNWVEAFRKIRNGSDEAQRKAAAAVASARDATSKPSLALARYAGTYTDGWYGDISLVLERDRLVMSFSKTPSLIGELEHWQYDTFVVRWRDRELRADAYVTFALNPDGSIDQAKMRAVSPGTDFSFDFHDLALKPKRP